MTRGVAPKVGSRYERFACLGHGATGTVYRGRDLVAGRDVAIKTLHDHLTHEPGVVGRFIQEGNGFRNLDHPYLTTVLDLVVDNGQLSIVMDLVDGGDVRELMAAGRPEPSTAVALVARTAEGLAALHNWGLVHRDLKPANILLQQEADGVTPRIADFGLARMVGEGRRADSGTFGTPLYLSPEVVDDTQPVGPAADVYALGIILFELLTGEAPFPRGGFAAVLSAQAGLQPPTVDGVPKDLRDLVAQMLARDAAMRPAADEVATRIWAVLPHLDDAVIAVGASPVPRSDPDPVALASLPRATGTLLHSGPDRVPAGQSLLTTDHGTRHASTPRLWSMAIAAAVLGLGLGAFVLASRGGSGGDDVSHVVAHGEPEPDGSDDQGAEIALDDGTEVRAPERGAARQRGTIDADLADDQNNNNKSNNDAVLDDGTGGDGDEGDSPFISPPIEPLESDLDPSGQKPLDDGSGDHEPDDQVQAVQHSGEDPQVGAEGTDDGVLDDGSRQEAVAGASSTAGAGNTPKAQNDDHAAGPEERQSDDLDAPPRVSVEAGASRATVSFSGSVGAATKVDYYEIGHNQYSETRRAASSPETWTGLTDGVDYRFRVRACNQAECSPWSTWSETVTPKRTVPLEQTAPQEP